VLLDLIGESSKARNLSYDSPAAQGLKTHTEADPGNDGGVDIHEACTRWVGRPLEPGIDNLQISRCAEPACDRQIVVRLERVFVLESEIQALAQQGNESAAELGPLKRYAERVVRAARSRTLATQPCEEGVLDWVRVGIRSVRREEHADPVLGVPCGLT
jgi:hypothetical protein